MQRYGRMKQHSLRVFACPTVGRFCQQAAQATSPANLWGFKTESGYCPVEIHTKLSENIKSQCDMFVAPTATRGHAVVQALGRHVLHGASHRQQVGGGGPSTRKTAFTDSLNHWLDVLGDDMFVTFICGSVAVPVTI